MGSKVVAAVVAVLAAGAAPAATISDLAGASQIADIAGADLSNNGGFSSGSGRNAVAYIFDEGSNAPASALFGGQSVQSFLLHYDRSNGILGPVTLGTAEGSFRIALSVGQSYLGLAGYTGNPLDSLGNARALQDTDARTDVTYPALAFTSLLFRGTEGNLLGDRVTLTSGDGFVDVAYRLSATGSSLDEVRFFVGGSAAAVPEPATWGLMIGGFGLIGGTLRTRRRALVAA